MPRMEFTAPDPSLATRLACAGAGVPQGLRLVTVTHFFPAHGGGLERVAERLVSEFAERGMQVRWYASDTDPAPSLASPRVTCVRVCTSNFIERLTQLPYPFWSLRVIPQLWRDIGNAHAVHVHEHLYFPSILAITIARLRGRPLIITQHMGALGLGRRGFTMLYELGAKVLGAMLFAAATRTVFISANVRNFFGRGSSPRTRLIFNGVDVQRFTPVTRAGQQAARQRLGLPLERRVVLFVGRFVRKKGLHIITTLSARFPDVLWLLVGSGPEHPGNARGNLQVAGRVEHDCLPLFYQSADLLILPSAGEGFPLVVQEALCCGAAVLSTTEVASACPDASDLIRACPTPRTEADLTTWEQALGNLLADEDYLQARDARAAAAHALWSWERCTSHYLDLLREITVN
jgi:glycosyltransferase involved in cell wall biosynthesis